MTVHVALLLLLPGNIAPEPRYPPDTLLLFVASWCAPCHGEIADLPEIAAAAAPRRVLVVGADETAATRAMVRAAGAGHQWPGDGASRLRLRATLLADVAGLPFSAAIGGDGKVCGTSRRPLNRERASALVAGCG